MSHGFASVYLYFTDSQLARSMPPPLGDEVCERAVKVLAAVRGGRVYASLSALFESPYRSGQTGALLDVLMHAGHFVVATPYLDVGEFVDEKRKQYWAEPLRYPDYFGGDIPDLPASLRLVPKSTDTTQQLIRGVESSLGGSGPAGRVLRRSSAESEILNVLRTREGRAMTLSLFGGLNGNGGDGRRAFRHLGRVLSLSYALDYLRAGDGVLPLGLGNELVESLAPSSFPYFDVPLLSKVWLSIGASESVERTHPHWWREWVERRETPEHGRLVLAVDSILGWNDSGPVGGIDGRRRRAMARFDQLLRIAGLTQQATVDRGFASQYDRIVDQFERVGDKAEALMAAEKSDYSFTIGDVGEGAVIQVGSNTFSSETRDVSSELILAFTAQVRAHVTALSAELNHSESEIIDAVEVVEGEAGAPTTRSQKALTFLHGLAIGVSGNAAYSGLLAAAHALGAG